MPRSFRRRALVVGAGLALALVATPVAPPAHACAPAPPPGFDVTINGEEAVIVWDAEEKVEHFIRRADFETEAEGFGFIVPTPAPPELAEVSDDVFEALAWQCRPRTRVRYETDGIELGMWLWLSARDGATAGAPEVTVLRHQKVAGYDAVVLAASEPGALVRWLGEHGYAHSDDLVAWAAPYVQQGWTFTAFKLDRPEGQSGLSTQAVRMSFGTPRPLYPYREPEGQRTAPPPPERTLRVFFVSDQRYRGDLGGGKTWAAETTYAQALGSTVLEDHLPGLLPSSAYLTVFVDRSNPRPGTDDLWFRPSDEGDVTPEPIVRTVGRPFVIPLDLLLMVGLMGAGLWWVVRRWRRRSK